MKEVDVIADKDKKATRVEKAAARAEKKARKKKEKEKKKKERLPRGRTLSNVIFRSDRYGACRRDTLFFIS